MVTDRVSSWLPSTVTGLTSAGPEWALPELTTFPNPTRTMVSLAGRGGTALRQVRLYDAAGRVVRRLTGSGSEIRWDLRDDSGRRVAAGVYWFVADVGARTAAQSVTVLSP